MPRSRDFRYWLSRVLPMPMRSMYDVNERSEADLEVHAAQLALQDAQLRLVASQERLAAARPKRTERAAWWQWRGRILRHRVAVVR